MMKIRIEKTVSLPDPRRLELYKRSPDLGPRVLFFTGGSALRRVSEELIFYTHNSIHIITPADSGGSSAKLRDAFDMPAIGDIRNRLLSLADRGLSGNPDIFKLFALRFPKTGEPDTLYREFMDILAGNHPAIKKIPGPMCQIIQRHLSVFNAHCDGRFDLRNACIGNLILTGGYLEYNRQLDPIIYIFSELVNVRGIVRPVLFDNLHLVSELANNRQLIGQHMLTGKEVPRIESRVERIFLSRTKNNPVPVDVQIEDKIIRLIEQADIICYPMGSFFSSIIASLLPGGVGKTISRNICPKVFIPNTGDDPELFDMNLIDQVNVLLQYLKKEDDTIRDKDVLSAILLDERNGQTLAPSDRADLENRGIQVIYCKLLSMRSLPFIDEKLLVPTLLSLV